MRIRTLAIATTLSLLGTTSLVSSVNAQKGITLQPQTAWAVKRVNEGTSNAYCAVARRFKQNLILTVAKNATRETSIALDFGKQSFSPGQQYKITLDPGAGGLRQYNVKPASAKAFVVRVGRDPKFMTSLSKTGYLRVELNNEIYNFNLADIDEGESHLDGCLVSLVSPAAGNDGSNSMLGKSSSDVAMSTLKREKRALENRLTRLEKENASLKASLKPADINPMPVVNSASSMIENLKEEIEVLKSQNANLKKVSSSVSSAGSEDVSIVALARENQILREKLEKSDDSSEINAQVKMLSDKVSDLEKENIQLTRKLKTASAERSSQELTQQLMALKSENKALRGSLENDNIAQENFRELRESIAKLKVRNDSLNNRVKSLSEEKARVVSQLNYYEDENDALKNKLSTVGNDNDLLSQLRKEIQKIEADNAKLLSRKEVTIESLHSEIEDLKTEKARLLSSNESETRGIVKKFEAQSEALRIKNQALKEELINLSKDQASLGVLKDKIATLESEKRELAASLQSSENEFGRLAEKLAVAQKSIATHEQLEAELASLDEKILVLESRNFDLKSKLENASNSSDSDQAEIAELKSELDKLGKENKKLRSEILASVSSEENKNKQISLLQKENEEFERRLSHKDSEVAANIAALEEDKKELQKQLSNLSSDIEGQLATLEQEKAALQERLQQQDLEKAATISEILAEKNRLEQMLSDHRTSKNEKIEALEMQISELQATHHEEVKISAELAALVKENQALEEQLSTKNDSKQQQISSLEKSLEALRIQNEKLVSEYQESEDQLEASIDQLKHENQQLQQTLERVELQKTLAVQSLNEEVGKAQSASSAKVSSLINENEQLQTENEDLSLALDNASEFNEMLQKDWQESLEKLEAMKADNAKYQSMVMSESADQKDTNAELVALKEANAELSEKLKEQQKEFLVLVQQYETLKKSQGAVQVSTDALKVRDERIKSLSADNKILKQEVSNLKNLIDNKETTEYREVSLQQKSAPVKPSTKKVEPVLNDAAQGAKHASQSDQARKNVERMRSKASDTTEKEREEISKLVAVEPAAGNVNEDAVSLDSMTGLSEAQKLEKRMKGQISRGRSITTSSKSKSAQLGSVNQLKPVTSEVIEPLQNNNGSSLAQSEKSRTVTNTIDEMQKPISSLSASNDIEDILERAGVQLSSDVQKVAKFSGPKNSAYQWKSSGELYGSAQQKPMTDINQFDDYVRDYLTTTESRCTGDFAIIPSATTDQGQTRIDSYEIACVGAGVDSSASVVFFSKDGLFTVLAHEAPTKSMANAMEARDKIATTIGRT